MVYAGFRNARRDIPDPPPAQRAVGPRRPPTRAMKKTWVPDLIRRRWSKPSTNSCSCWRSKRRRASRTWPPYWHARPQQFFKCLLRPLNGRLPKNNTWVRGPDDIEAHLVFFSTLEELRLKLAATGRMDHATIKLYEPSLTLIIRV